MLTWAQIGDTKESVPRPETLLWETLTYAISWPRHALAMWYDTEGTATIAYWVVPPPVNKTLGPNHPPYRGMAWHGVVWHCMAPNKQLKMAYFFGMLSKRTYCGKRQLSHRTLQLG